MKSNVFCIVGKTGSGKTKVLNELLEDKFFINETKLHKVVYWTTRSPRVNEKDGEDYHFGIYNTFKDTPSSDILEYRTYETKDNGTSYYWTKKSDLEGYDNYIISCGAEQVYNYIDTLNREKYNIYIIYINTDLITKMKRMVDGRLLNDTQAKEFCRRVTNENKEFEKMEMICKDNKKYRVSGVSICDNNNDSIELFNVMITQLKIWICCRV